MAPRLQEEDPVTAEYDVYLTPAIAEQIFLLQYPNRDKDKAYNRRGASCPETMRIKQNTGHLEMDVNLNTRSNFNKYQSLRWADALSSAKLLHNSTATFGLSAGFAAPKTRPAGGQTGKTALKDKVDRDLQISNDLADFNKVGKEPGMVLNKQTLGGQIIRSSDDGEQDKPVYFLGAFRGNQLHLTRVDGTVQMRPQFHNVDAEDQRNRIAATRAAALTDSEMAPKAPQARGVHQAFKGPNEETKSREEIMREQLRAIEEESWTQLDYIDEDEDEAYDAFNNTMFVRDVESAPHLKSIMTEDEYIDAISAPRHDPGGKRRKRAPRKKHAVDIDEEIEAEEQAAAAAVAEAEAAAAETG